MSYNNYESLNLPELKNICKERSLSYTNLKKKDIIELLISDDSKTNINTQKIMHESRVEERITPSNNTESDSAFDNESTNNFTNESTNKSTYKSSNNTTDNKTERQTGFESTTVETGVLEVIPEGYGFLRMDNYLSSNTDVFVPPSQIKRFRLKTGDKISGQVKNATKDEKYRPLIYIHSINDDSPEKMYLRKNFEDLVPIYPTEKITLETDNEHIASRIIDLVCPIGKGQRGMIVAPPKVGKTMLLKEIANSIITNNPDMYLIVLLIDERPEEVTDIKRSIENKRADVIYSTFDEVPEHHKKVAEMTLERAKRLVEHNKDVIILLDSITRLARAYNILVPQSGRTLSGGLDPNALHMPKKFFGSARNIENGGSLTIISTALVETGSKMDEVIFEEFKGTGNMEIVLDRKLAQKRIFPSIDLTRSSTRRDDLLLTESEQDCVSQLTKLQSTMQSHDFIQEVIKIMQQTDSNERFINYVDKFTKD